MNPAGGKRIKLPLFASHPNYRTVRTKRALTQLPIQPVCLITGRLNRPKHASRPLEWQNCWQRAFFLAFQRCPEKKETVRKVEENVSLLFINLPNWLFNMLIEPLIILHCPHCKNSHCRQMAFWLQWESLQSQAPNFYGINHLNVLI